MDLWIDDEIMWQLINLIITKNELENYAFVNQAAVESFSFNLKNKMLIEIKVEICY